MRDAVVRTMIRGMLLPAPCGGLAVCLGHGRRRCVPPVWVPPPLGPVSATGRPPNWQAMIPAIVCSMHRDTSRAGPRPGRGIARCRRRWVSGSGRSTCRTTAASVMSRPVRSPSTASSGVRSSAAFSHGLPARQGVAPPCPSHRSRSHTRPWSRPVPSTETRSVGSARMHASGAWAGATRGRAAMVPSPRSPNLRRARSPFPRISALLTSPRDRRQCASDSCAGHRAGITPFHYPDRRGRRVRAHRDWECGVLG